MKIYLFVLFAGLHILLVCCQESPQRQRRDGIDLGVVQGQFLGYSAQRRPVFRFSAFTAKDSGTESTPWVAHRQSSGSGPISRRSIASVVVKRSAGPEADSVGWSDTADAANQMSENGFYPSDFSRVEKFHKLFGMILRQNRACQMTGLEQTKVRLEQGIVARVAIFRGWRNND